MDSGGITVFIIDLLCIYYKKYIWEKQDTGKSIYLYKINNEPKIHMPEYGLLLLSIHREEYKVIHWLFLVVLVRGWENSDNVEMRYGQGR